MGLEKVNERFDFTDSIIIAMEWDRELFDFLLTLDYYWDVQEGRTETRTLTIRFMQCQVVELQQRQDFLSLDPKHIHRDSWYTIVKTDGNHVDVDCQSMEYRVFTNDDLHPWLKIVCRNVSVEDMANT